MYYYKNNKGQLVASAKKLADNTLSRLSQKEADEILKELTRSSDVSGLVEAALNKAATEKGFDSILEAATYTASANAKYKADAKALIKWRDQVWAWYEGLKNPTEADLALMPKLEADNA
ncbi:MAG: hypothetical protein LBN32_00405 [Helicobacteraceae bacterium]|jgi:hypothetical protein|nr:hypothetical protein [Helicobacteraceae bacterium]